MTHDAAAPHQAHHPALAHHFDSLAQQREAATLGMWVFLVTEVLFFGGLFATYMVYREGTDAFAAASNELDVTLGTINTVVLITSSLTMALAVHAAQLGQRKTLMLFLIATMMLGAVFLGIKAVEYYHKFVEHHVPGPTFQFEAEHFRHAQIFFSLYFVMTGLHAVHMIIGIGIMLVMLYWSWNGTISEEVSQPDRDQRALLALRRHRLDLPVPAAVFDPDGTHTDGLTHSSQTRLLHDLRDPVVLHLPDGADRVPRSRRDEHGGRARDRHVQGGAGDPVLHAREVQHPADRAVVLGSIFWLGILLTLTMSDYLTRVWRTYG